MTGLYFHLPQLRTGGRALSQEKVEFHPRIPGSPRVRNGVAPWREEYQEVPGGHGEEAGAHIEQACLVLEWR